MNLILFDIDGTLVNVHGSGRRALERAFLDTFPLEEDQRQALHGVYFAGSSDPRILRDMGRAVGIAESEVDIRLAEIETRYLMHLPETLAATPNRTACPGVPELLERLRGWESVTLGLVTGNLEPGARIKLEPFGLNRFFEFGGFGADGPERARIAAQAVERAQEFTGLRFPPDQVVLVGDTVQDVASAKPHGYLSAAVGTGWESLDALRAAGADAVFPDLTPGHGFETWLMSRWNLGLSGNGRGVS